MDKKYTVLYIDDEESNLRVFKNTFRRDFNILLASSAQEGIQVLIQTKIDVIITDQRMPGKTGLELLKEIHYMFPDIPPHRLMVSVMQPQTISILHFVITDYSGLYRNPGKPTN